MRQAYRLVVSLFVFLFLFVTVLSPAKAGFAGRCSTGSVSDLGLPERAFYGDSGRSRSPYCIDFSPAKLSANYSDETELSLYEAITNRLGLPYRFRGADDRGYDCSGLVWRVFHEAGIEFERGPARALWQWLPEATERERSKFGTLVFFKGLNHIGIVRDAHSFYHASSSRGVVRSYFSDYWEKRIIGYRRVLAPVGTVKKWRGKMKR
jgi:hypothetical protein